MLNCLSDVTYEVHDCDPSSRKEETEICYSYTTQIYRDLERQHDIGNHSKQVNIISEK